MRIDVFTKIVLTVIAIALVAIAANPFLHPAQVAAQTRPTGLEFAATGDGSLCFFDSRSGEVWVYNPFTLEGVRYRMTELGKPLTK